MSENCPLIIAESNARQRIEAFCASDVTHRMGFQHFQSILTQLFLEMMRPRLVSNSNPALYFLFYCKAVRSFP